MINRVILYLLTIFSRIGKLKSMWRTEASERRREKQLKSFSSLFEGRLELELILLEKLGLPFKKSVEKPAG